MIRVFLALVSGLICGIVGMRQAGRIRAGQARLKRWEYLLARLCLLLKEQSLSLPEIFLHLSEGAQGPDGDLRRLAEGMLHQPLQPLERLYTPDGPEGDILSRLMGQLDRGSMASRLLAATQAREEIALLAHESAHKAAADARMWATLGWSFGACLFLMLL